MKPANDNDPSAPAPSYLDRTIWRYMEPLGDPPSAEMMAAAQRRLELYRDVTGIPIGMLSGKVIGWDLP